MCLVKVNSQKALKEWKPPSGLSIEQYSRDYRDETFRSQAC